MTYTQPSLDFDSRQAAYWDTQIFSSATIQNPVSDPNLLGGTAMANLFTRSHPSGTVEDVAQWQIHYVMRPGTAGLSEQLNDGDMAAVESSFLSNVWTVLAPLTTSGWTFSEHVWRDFGADFPLTTPEDPGQTPPVHKYGPVRRRTTVGVPGNGSGIRLPDQVAATVTLKTGSRKHWGRVYLGGFASPLVSGNAFGRWSTTNVDAICNAFHSHFQGLAGLPRVLEPVVWSSRYSAIMTVDQIQVDDVPDIIRRRRPKQAAYRKVNG